MVVESPLTDYGVSFRRGPVSPVIHPSLTLVSVSPTVLLWTGTLRPGYGGSDPSSYTGFFVLKAV